MYFNLNILGMDNQGFYEDSDNIDESETEIMTFERMRMMLKELTNVSNDYHEDGIVLFELNEQETELIKLDFQYFNDSLGSLVFSTA